MLLLQEKALVGGELLEIELHDDLTYRLRYGTFVEYTKGRKVVGRKATPYAFRSVEQLRYDFERDVAASGGRLA